MSNDIIISQHPLGQVTFAENPEPRCPCLLLLDTSGSMAGQPITELNDGLREFYAELQGDSLAIKRVEVALISFWARCTACSANSIRLNVSLTPQARSGRRYTLWRSDRKGNRLIRNRREEVPGERHIVLPGHGLFDHGWLPDRRMGVRCGQRPGKGRQQNPLRSLPSASRKRT